MKRRKVYRKVRDKVAGKVRSLHRVLAEQMLARPLAPGEIVHHEGGDSASNARGNLRGMPSLFPELVTQDRRGTLFESLSP